MSAAQATGRIKWYQIVVGGMMLLSLPISFLFLRMNYPPQTVMYIAIINSMVCLLLRLILLSQMIDLSIIRFFKQVVFNVILVSIASYTIPLYLTYQFHQGINRFIIVFMIGLINAIIASFFIGLSESERKFTMSIIYKALQKFSKIFKKWLKNF
jgi:hypothetical protein